MLKLQQMRYSKKVKNHTHVKKAEHTSEFLLGIFY